MATVICTNCGSHIEETAKFCRHCGHPSSLLEATTRKFEEPLEYHAPTRGVSAAPTSPTYYPPAHLQPQPPYDTSGLRHSSDRRTIVVLAGIIVFLVIAVFALGITWYVNNFSSSNQPAIMAPPAHPPIPEEPAPPPPPPPPPPPVGEEGASTLNGDLIYPGSKTVMDLRNKGEGVIRLETDDPMDKVIDWYVEKLKPTQQLRIPGGNAVIRNDSVTAIIHSNDGKTNILIKQ